MSKKIKLSPALFLVLEFIILLPSLLFVLGLLSWVLFRNPFLYQNVLSANLLQNAAVTIVSPLAGGFLAYQFLERYKPKGFIKTKAKGILAYSILEIGLVLAYYLATAFS